MATTVKKAGSITKHKGSDLLNVDTKKDTIRTENMVAARAVAEAIRISLGPRGLDKMICQSNGNVLLSNDGATLLNSMQIVHPIGKMMVELSRAQDVEAGDGTTSVVVLCGAIIHKAIDLCEKKRLHPQSIIKGIKMATDYAMEILDAYSSPVPVTDTSCWYNAARVSIASKIISKHGSKLAEIAVEACKQLAEPNSGTVFDINKIRIVKVLIGTIDNTYLKRGILLQTSITRRFTQSTIDDDEKSNFTDHSVTYRIKNAKVGIIQFCISAPKTDMDNSISVASYSQMDRLLREEKLLIAKTVKTIMKTGCNLLLVQKSILREDLSDLALDYLGKAKIGVIRNIERDQINSIAEDLGCYPIASIDHFTEDKLTTVGEVVEKNYSGTKIVELSGLNGKPTVSICLHGSNQELLDEFERSLHDSLCVIRCLYRENKLLPGGGCVELELSEKLQERATTMTGTHRIVIQAFAEALLVIPKTLAENSALSALDVIKKLLAAHKNGKIYSGIDAKSRTISMDLSERHVLMPSIVVRSYIQLASETAQSIIRIDDVVPCR